jgi:type VI secretion system protein ImpF
MPSLLDRLTQDTRLGAPAQLFFSPRQYLRSVRRDLEWLIQTEVASPGNVLLTRFRPPLLDDGDSRQSTLADFPMARNSIVAFGVTLARGEMQLQSSARDITAAIDRAIRVFEPRIDPGSLRVRAADKSRKPDEEMSANILGFEIEGQVRLKPLPEHLLLKAFYNTGLAQWHFE